MNQHPAMRRLRARERVLRPRIQSTGIQPTIGNLLWIGGNRSGCRHVDHLTCNGGKSLKEMLDRFWNQKAFEHRIDAEVAEDRGAKTLTAFAADHDIDAAAAPSDDVACRIQIGFSGSLGKRVHV